MWFVTSQKNGVSALGLQRELGLGSYETAWTWLHKLRRAMVRPGRDLLSGTIEVDETYVGGPEQGTRGRETESKAIVAIAVEKNGRGLGRIRLQQIGDVSTDSLLPFVQGAVEQVRREEARNNFQIKGRRYIFLKNVDRLTQEEREALSRLEAQNLDTIQAMQIRMNLQQLFTMSVKSARRFLDRWNAWVQVCDLAPMKKLAKTITAKSEGILRSIATGLSNGVLEAINGNVQAAKRKAKGYRTKRNLKAIVYLIAGDVLASSPI